MMHDHDDDSHVYVPRDERPSRSQLRREALDVLKLAQALAALSDAQLARIPLDDDLRAEVASTRAVKQQIARKRAEQFLAKQLRKLDDADLEPMRAALEHDREHARREAAALHRVETWRERLITMLRDSLLEKLVLEELGDTELTRFADEIAEHKRDPYSLVEELIAKLGSR